jgi:hypothetical protein
MVSFGGASTLTISTSRKGELNFQMMLSLLYASSSLATLKTPHPLRSAWTLKLLPIGRLFPESEEESNWIRTFLNLSVSSGNAQATSYSNLCQIVALETVPSDLPPRSDYKATMHVRPGVPHTDHFSYYTEINIPTADSVTVTEAEFTTGRFMRLPTCGLASDDTNAFR